MVTHTMLKHVSFPKEEFFRLTRRGMDGILDQASQIKGFNSRVNIPKEDFPMFGA
jgi:hypothetical protein